MHIQDTIEYNSNTILTDMHTTEANLTTQVLKTHVVSHMILMTSMHIMLLI